MRRRNGILVCTVGMLLLIYGLWNLYMSLFHYQPEKIETLQGVNFISTMEGYGTPVYVHPNKGVGPTDARYDLTIRVEYLNVKGNLSIDDYYVQYGSVPYEPRQKLNSRQYLTGNGSTTLEIPPTYVGVHVILATPDYDPNPPIEIRLYTIHYEPRPDNAQIMSSLTANFMGASLVSIGAMLTILGNQNDPHH